MVVGPGSRFVMPRGFQGSWEVMETTTKRFVIFEAHRNRLAIAVCPPMARLEPASVPGQRQPC